MKLDRVEVSIRALKSKDNVNIEDVLKFFVDLCKDVSNHYGNSIDELPVGNENDLIGNLISCGRLLTAISRKYPELFLIRRGNRLKKKMDELEEQIKKYDESKVTESPKLYEQICDHLTINDYIEEAMKDFEEKKNLNKKELEDLVRNNLQL